MYIGGLDIGTTGCKIVLFDEKGTLQKKVYREYEVKRENGLHEVDGIGIFDAVKAVLTEVKDFDIKAIGITSFGETCVMLDEEDMPCAPSMLYTDPRGSEESKQLIEKFGIENLAFKTGTMPHEMYSIAKIMWVKKNMPESFKRVKHILLMQDFAAYMLTGKCQIDYSLAARSGAFDVAGKCWDKEILDFCGIDEGLLSEAVPSGTVVGEIKSDVKAEIGFKSDTVIVSGCHDQIAALVGANVLESGQAMDGIGTVECVPVIMDKIPTDFSIFECGYSFVPHINGKFACLALSYAGGATLKWFRDNFSDMSYKELDENVADKPTDLLLMPHFAGAATPYMDTKSKAAILGLTFEHTKMDIYKALMEGTSYEIMLNLQKLESYGIKLGGVTATGGGANSDVWLQIKADVFGIPVKTLDNSEIGASGTAYLAGKAVGVYGDKNTLVNEKSVFYPNKEKTAFYSKQMKKYAEIYSAVKAVQDYE